MADQLHGIMQQIENAEKQAREEKKALTLVNKNILETKERRLMLDKEIKLMEKECSEMEIELSSLENDKAFASLKKDSIREQVKRLENEQCQLKELIKLKENETNEVWKSFTLEVERFSNSYNPLKFDFKKKDKDDSAKLVNLEGHLNSLENEIEELSQELVKLQEDFREGDYEGNQDHLKNEVQCKKDELAVLLADVEKLEEEKETNELAPQQDPEFLSIRDELEAHRRRKNDAKCRALEAQVEKLQREQWQQQCIQQRNRHPTWNAQSQNDQLPAKQICQAGRSRNAISKTTEFPAKAVFSPKRKTRFKFKSFTTDDNHDQDS